MDTPEASASKIAAASSGAYASTGSTP